MTEVITTTKTEAIWPEAQAGTLVKVHEKLKETNTKGEEKERIQVFEGLILSRHGGNTPGATITVRKSSFGIFVEKIYPLHNPVIAKIEVVKKYRTRRAKLYFMRDNPKRLKEIKKS